MAVICRNDTNYTVHACANCIFFFFTPIIICSIFYTWRPFDILPFLCVNGGVVDWCDFAQVFVSI